MVGLQSWHLYPNNARIILEIQRDAMEKWLTVFALDGIDPLSGNEPSILRYVGFLLSEKEIAGNALRNYMSSVTTAHTRIGKSITITPLVSMAVSAYRHASTKTKMLQHPTSTLQRRVLPSSVASSILNEATSYPDSELKRIRNASATLIFYVFFKRGEAGASIQFNNITVSRQYINIAVELNKKQARV